MPRPVKWSRDLHRIRDRAARSRTETWGRREVEDLFGVGRASAQTLMKAIGDVHPLAGAHFVERASLLAFLDAVMAAPSVEEGLRRRMLEVEPPAKSKPLRVTLPADLRSSRLSDLPPHINVSPGRVLIEAPTATAMLESLAALALAIQNDIENFRINIEPSAPSSQVVDEELRELFTNLRGGSNQVDLETSQPAS